jgi:hypothetical protein
MNLILTLVRQNYYITPRSQKSRKITQSKLKGWVQDSPAQGDGMSPMQFARPMVGAAAALTLIFTAGTLIRSQRVHADDEDREELKIQQGFAIAPVQLNLAGKSPALVGLGSFIVNAHSSCNECHSAGPATQYLPGGNPFLGQHPVVNPATYLGGGRDFGPFPGPGPFPHIISRNLTPDKTGLPVGGHTFKEFREIMRTGMDLDHVHPSCTGAPNGSCLPPPFDGSLLQIMPWPVFQNMSDHELLAIYAYLSAIPCIEGPPAPSLLHNDCQ